MAKEEEGFDYEQLVKATESFSQSRLIGKGSHGSVYKGTFHHQISDDRHLIFAVKRASVNGVDVLHDNFKKLDNEIRVLSSLHEKYKDKSRNTNPYVVNFLGTSHHDHSVSEEEHNKLLVMEFMPNGSLYDLLHSSSVGGAAPPSWPNRVKIAMQIARAIQFLHENRPSIIHRDIKSTNILFDSNWNAKMADFGLAVMDQTESRSSHQQTIQPAGTIGYLDPSYTNHSKLSTKTDIFSFGVVLLEIISCRKAIDVSRAPASIVDWAMPLIKEQKLMEICDARVALPTFMEGAIKHMLHLAARCVSSEDEDRPGIGEILIGEACFVDRIERVGWVSIWMRMSHWGSVMMLKRNIRQKKWAKRQQKKSDNNICGGKMMLKEILAEISLK